jgi:hypothetical protein
MEQRARKKLLLSLIHKHGGNFHYIVCLLHKALKTTIPTENEEGVFYEAGKDAHKANAIVYPDISGLFVGYGHV